MDEFSLTARPRKASNTKSPSPLPYKCHFDICQESFATLEEVQKHSFEDQNHPFCSKCKAQFQSKQAYMEHKFKSLYHFICPMCNTEFQSQSGRDFHLEKAHPPEQQLVCQGCTGVFPSPASMMQHLETGNCEGFNPLRLTMEMNRRQNIHAVFKSDPRDFKSNKTDSQMLRIEERKAMPGNMTEAAMETDTIKGSRPIADEDPTKDISLMRNLGLHAPIPMKQMGIQAESQLPMLPTYPHTSGTSTPSRPENQLMDSDDIPLDYPVITPTQSVTPRIIFDKPAAPQCSDLIVFDEEEPQKKLPQETIKTDITAIVPKDSPKPPHSQFPGLQLSKQCTGISPKDPITPEELNPDKYLNESREYICPCGWVTHSRERMVNHIAEERRWCAPSSGSPVFPQCNKSFISVSALVAHMENVRGRCSISSRDLFNRALEDVTGGIIGIAGDHGGSPVVLARQLENMQVSTAPLEVRIQAQAAERGEDGGEVGVDRLKSLGLGGLESEENVQGEEQANW